MHTVNRYNDIHTHSSVQTKDVQIILNIRAEGEKESSFSPSCSCFFSYGIHPYDVQKVKFNKDFFFTLRQNQNFKAVGEIGLDFRFQSTAATQVMIFKSQLETAKELEKPVIIHAVKSLPQVLDIINKTGFPLPFIIHGFRGSFSQANEIIKRGGFISLSPFLPKETEKIYSFFSDSILLETDETGMDIVLHYQNVASLLNIEEEQLIKQIQSNFKRAVGFHYL